MAASEEFKQALRAGKLAEAFITAMSKTPELEITTWIASPNQPSAQPEPGHRLRTQINLISGKINNEIGDRFIHEQAYHQVHQFHLERVSNGHQTIKQNLLSLQQMFRLMAVLQNYQQGGEYRELNWSNFHIDDTPKIENDKSANRGVSEQGLSEIDVDERDSTFATNVFTIEEHLNGSQHTAFISVDEDEDDATNLLSLEDLEAEPEVEQHPPTDEQSLDEEWGEWLEEDEDPAMEADILDLDSLQLNEAERWDELDNTEFLPNTSIRFSDKNRPNSNFNE